MCTGATAARQSALCNHDAAPPELYTLSLHDALPISCARSLSSVFHSRSCYTDHPWRADDAGAQRATRELGRGGAERDRKSTRLNSSHVEISYAVFCLKKKNTLAWNA